MITRLIPRTRRAWFGLALSVSLVALTTISPRSARASSLNSYLQWPMFGQNFANTASSLTEFTISPRNVATLKPKWVATMGGDVSARPAVVDGAVYIPDWGGNFSKLDANTGQVIWSRQISTYTGIAGDDSRTSPAVAGNTVYIGTQQGAYLLAIDTTTGQLQWKTQLDPHPLAVDTQSPVVFNGVVYVGVASSEEFAAAQPGYVCCSFRGSMMALNATTGSIIWKTYTVPTGYTGGSVWGSTPVVDPLRGSVYYTTGNNYSTPTDPQYQSCIAGGGTQATCLSPDDHVDSVLALNMLTGAVKWATRLSNGDDWNVACVVGNVGNCPTPSGPDYDFGSGVNLFVIWTTSGPREMLGAGQKSGVYTAFDPDTGHIIWSTQVGPGSSLGGMLWGAATDGRRIYVSIADLYGIPYALQPSGQTDSAGSWSALDPATGKILWQTADPNGAIDTGPLAVANGVVYAPSMAGSSTSQNMFALDAGTGNILWSAAAGGSVNAGAAIVNGVVYWGSGYSHLGIPGMTDNNKFYAFSPGGQ